MYEPSTTQELYGRLDDLAAKVTAELKRQGFSSDRIKLEHQLHMRFDGSDTALMISAPEDGSKNYQRAFEEAYEAEFGFLLETKIIVDDVKVSVVVTGSARRLTVARSRVQASRSISPVLPCSTRLPACLATRLIRPGSTRKSPASKRPSSPLRALPRVPASTLRSWSSSNLKRVML